MRFKLWLLRWILRDERIHVYEALLFSESYMSYIRDIRSLKGLHSEAVGVPNGYDKVIDALRQIHGTPPATIQPDSTET